MAYSGDVVAAGVRTDAIARIDSVFERAAAAADAAGFDAVDSVKRAPFELRSITRAQADAFLDEFRAALVWTDEGNCFNRAMFGAHLLNSKVGVGTSPLDDTFAGAIAIRHHYHQGPNYTGGFHATLALNIEGEHMIADLLPGNRELVKYADWAAGREADTFTIRPWAGSGIEVYAGGPKRSDVVTRPYFEWAKGQLANSWNRYVQVTGAAGAADAAAGGGAAAEAAAHTGGWWSGLSSSGKAAVIGGVAAAGVGAALLVARARRDD